MRYGVAWVAVALAAVAVGGCANLDGRPTDVRYTYDSPPGYGDEEELPLGSYDGRGVKVEGAWEQDE